MAGEYGAGEWGRGTMADDEREEQKRKEKEEEDAGIVIVPSIEKSETKSGEIVKSAVLATEKSRGHAPWQPGQSGNPLGRPKKEVEQAYLNAFKEAATPDELMQVLRGLIFHKSWRAQVAGAKLLTENLLGLPVQRVITEDSALGQILDALRQRNSE